MKHESKPALSRRAFFGGAAGGIGSMLVAARAVAQPQQPSPRAGMIHDSSLVRDTTNFGVMDVAVKPVRLPPKPNATPQLTTAQRDALEHQLHCQCGCTLDIFTCRTTDSSCQVSPAMHRDVMALVEGGYSAQEIIDAFVGTYGQRVLMAPPRSGFNILAWISPGIAVLVAGAFILAFLRRSQAPSPAPLGPRAHGLDATDDELARLEAAIRRDDR
jgi:cytochrome c-type biogenesis protein CcmH